jgi:hypothetical protein
MKFRVREREGGIHRNGTGERILITLKRLRGIIGDAWILTRLGEHKH